MISQLRSLKKHDKALYRFCELRRKIMSYLREKNENIPEHDYYLLRELLDNLNDTIHDFNNHKKSLFIVKDIHISLQKYVDSSFYALEKKINQNKKLSSFFSEYRMSMLLAFLTFNPTLKYHLIIIIMIAFVNLLGDRLIEIKKYLIWIDEQSKLFNLQKNFI